MRPPKLTVILLLLALPLLLVTTSPPQIVRAAQQDVAQAVAVTSTLFGATAGGDGNAPSNFYSIDPSTGVATLIGPIGFKAVSAMDFNPSTGVLYATGRRLVGSNLVLMKINTVTGVGTEVGLLGSGFNVQDMSFRNSDGKLFAYFQGLLITIDPATGATTTVGLIDFFGDGNGLAFSPTDILFHSNDSILSTINQTTGAKTLVTGLHFPLMGPFQRVVAMDFRPGTSTLFGSVVTGSGGLVYLATIDISTGDVTAIGVTTPRMDAIAWSVPVMDFDVCLQDDATGNLMRWNSATGDYLFTQCGRKGFTLGGKGKINQDSCSNRLEDLRPERSVRATFNFCSNSGSASIQVFPTGPAFMVSDTDTLKDTCSCP